MQPGVRSAPSAACTVAISGTR